ncbi:MAG: hypothetical protein ABI920_11960 [Casimicrobiaceae bacterium]
MKDVYPTGNSVQRALHVLRHAGPRSFVFRLLSECGYRRMLLLARSLDAPIRLPRCPPGVDLAELQAHDFAPYGTLRGPDAAGVFARRCSSGHRCFVARCGAEVVSACWAATHAARTDYLDCPIVLGPGDVYLYDAFTAASARGLALAPLVCAYQLTVFHDEGCVRAVRATVPENLPALHAHAKSGFGPIAVMGRVGLGPWRHHFHRKLGHGA